MNNFKRVSAAVLAGMALLCASGASHGLGFGHASSRAILGDTLRVTIPLRLEAGEHISNECLAADVYFGDDKVAPKAVFAEVVPGEGNERVLQITTNAAINEPVVTLYLAAGCTSRITRKIIAFADPPGVSAPTVAETTPVPVGEAIEAATLPPGNVLNRPKAAPAQPVRSASRAATSGEDDGGSAKPRRKSPSAALAGAPSLVVAGSVARNENAAPAKAPSPGRKPTAKGKTAAAPVAVAEAARLVLDPMDADAMVSPALRMTPTLGAPVQAEDASPELKARRDTAAAMWLALNATPEQMTRDRQRLQDLEQRLAQLKQEGEQAKQRAAALQARVDQAEAAPHAGKWLYGIGVLALIGVAASAYLFRRLRQEQQRNGAWWSQQSSQLNDNELEREAELGRTSTEFVHVPPAPSPVVAPAPAPVPPPVAPVEVRKPMAAPAGREPTMSLGSMPAMSPRIVTPHTEPLREVSVEELIDLEQQAEFFVVLGQDDAAIDLLEGHVHHTTGASPLPFLKLLEIYRRVGRRADYERVQAEFNQRFNAYAPSWEADLQQGHSLEDYPGVIERLQALWSTPAQAMEVLEKSLTRPDSSADTFELPAYRELLFLYAVARDLSERDATNRRSVDLLLPVVDLTGQPPVEGSVLDAQVIEPLMATRPMRAQPEVSPSINLDLELDDLEDPDNTTGKH